jgi:NADPH2:quinone reductase
MSQPVPSTALQLRSLVKPGGELELSLADTPVAEPGPDFVVVRMQAAPINPSDLGLLLAGADLATAKAGGTPERPMVTAKVPEAALPSLAARLGQSLPVGIEGAGVVVKAGPSEQAQALLGKIVATSVGGAYSQYVTAKASTCLALPEGATAADGASSFVNPMTALGMVETMRMEGYSALVHTAAASNLGQMLNRICLKDGIGLVNVVRSPAQAALLREQGAKYVCDSSSAPFKEELTQALAATGATLAFDAVGGGRLAGTLLACMEAAAAIRAASGGAREYSRYGSSVHKQVYIYGALDTGPTELARNFGMAWGVGGWLLTPFLQKIGAETRNRMRARVAGELKTTFASRYTDTVSLTEALRLDTLRACNQRATGQKFLINPNKS